MRFYLKWLNGDVFHFFIQLGLKLLYDLIAYVVDMCPSANGCNPIHKWNLLELTLWAGDHHLPPLRVLLFIVNDLFVFWVSDVELYIVLKTLDLDFLSVEVHGTFYNTSHVIDPFLEETEDFIGEALNREFLKVWDEGYFSIIFSLV